MDDRQARIDALLAPLEARPLAGSTVEIARRRSALAFGGELSRIQGARFSSTSDRVSELIILGKASRKEAMTIAAELARQELLADTER